MRWPGLAKNCSKGLMIALALSACQSVDPVPDGSHRVVQAWTRNQPAPRLSEQYDKAFSPEVAYRIQHTAFAQYHQGRSPLGFKAGLTSVAAQQAYGTNQPLAGALPPDALLKPEEDGYHQTLQGYGQPMAEVEIGFRIGQRIQYRLPDVNALRPFVTEVMAAVELPDLAYQNAGKPISAGDLIASNAGARRLILGPARAPSQIDVNNLAVTLYREGEVLTQGHGREVQGDQWQALLWLVNRAVASGWQIEPGQVLITGAIGKAVPLRAGLHVADFGQLGHIEWRAE